MEAFDSLLVSVLGFEVVAVSCFLILFTHCALIAALFVLVRTVGYETGIVVSNVDTFPLPPYGWTVIFGVVFGCSYVLLYPFFATESRRLSVTIRLAGLALGLNWMIFNGFIGMIFSETMGQALLRSGLDVVALAIASILITRFPEQGRASVARA